MTELPTHLVSLKRLLRTFLLRVHPDLLHGSPKHVRAANEASLKVFVVPLLLQLALISRCPGAQPIYGYRRCTLQRRLEHANSARRPIEHAVPSQVLRGPRSWNAEANGIDAENTRVPDRA